MEAEQASLPRYEATLRKLLPIVPASARDTANTSIGVLVSRAHLGVLDTIAERVLNLTGGRAEIVAEDVDAVTRAMLIVVPRDLAAEIETLLGREDISRVRLDRSEDIAATGWFLVDPSSGAIVGTMLQLVFPRDGAVIELAVRYEREGNLGLWVPVEMTETYSVRGTTMERRAVLDARAEYSRFRRFQVTSETETKVKIVK